MGITEKAVEMLKEGFVCNSCLGRQFASLLTGYTNEQRGKIIRQFVAFLVDSGEKIDVDSTNFYGIKFRNVKIKSERPTKCKICKNFFLEKVDQVAKRIAKELSKIEFDTFVIGSMVPDDVLMVEENIWKKSGIEFVEPIKSEINRELGKRIEKLTKKKFDRRNPGVTAIVDLKTGRVRVEIRSLYIFGEYKKIIPKLPLTRWRERKAKTSVQEIVEKPLLKITKGKKSKFHTPRKKKPSEYSTFVIEIVEPVKRKVDLKKIAKQINKSKKLKVTELKFTTKNNSL